MTVPLVDTHVTRRLLAHMEKPHSLIATSAMRIGAAIYLLALYLCHVRIREFIWGPSGQVSQTQFHRMVEFSGQFSLYTFVDNERSFEALFWLSVAATFLYLIGWQTRLTGALTYISSYSLYVRNPWIGDAGFNLLELVLFSLAFAETGAHFGIDSARVRARLARNKPFTRALNVLHNFAVVSCSLQVCVLYFFASFYKIMGHKWQDGTALYYTLRSSDFNIGALSPLIYGNAFVVAFGTYSTLAFQLAFPWLIWNRRAKPVLFVGACLIHGLIALTMGLVWFSYAVVMSELIFFDDSMFRLFEFRAGRLAFPLIAIPQTREQHGAALSG